MELRQAQIAETPIGRDRRTPGWYLLRGLVALSLIYYAWLMLDLALHPFAPGISFDGSIAVAARYYFALIGTGVIVVGAFIMRRVPGNCVGPLLILWGLEAAGLSMREDLGSPLITSIPHLLINFYSSAVAWMALTVLVMSFPTGQIYPRRAVPWVALYVILNLIGAIFSVMAQSPGAPASFQSPDVPVNPFYVPALAPFNDLVATTGPILPVLGNAAVIVSLVLRYRAAQSRERQQIKWFAWVTGLFLALITIILALSLDASFNSAMNGTPLGTTAPGLFYGIFVAAPAVGIGLAILRNRLWEIDLVINRTLVYGSLTALLALLYFGLIFALQALLQGILPQNNDVAIVVSTLAIAALFQPLRHRIQRIIDLRFYRRKYDAARTLAAFSATLRDEVDLTQLSEQLVAVVQETMQPTHVSLWLRPASQIGKTKIHRPLV